MTSIWQNDGSVWKLLGPKGFPDEAALHSLIENAPQMLPLSGDPRLVIVGKEVYLNGNYADLIGIEPDGQLSVIEVKLNKSAEARRAVVAQVLTYAASLAGMDRKALEAPVLLGSYLLKRGVPTLADAISLEDQTEQIDIERFNDAVDERLREGAFRLVMVLDDAPQELIRLVGYLEAVTQEKLVIDLITVSSFEVGGTQIVVPTRIDPRQALQPMKPAGEPTSPTSVASEGTGEFVRSIEYAPAEHREDLHRLADWVAELEKEGLAKSSTTRGKSRWILNVRIPSESAGLISIYNQNGAFTTFYRSLFERRARASIPRVEAALHPEDKLGQGTVSYNITNELLTALKDAYREARQGVVTPVPDQPIPVVPANASQTPEPNAN